MSTIVSEVTTYMIASLTPPAITCPDWCVVTQDEHACDLGFFGGTVVHASANDGVWHTLPAYVDGTPDPEDVPRIFGADDLADGLSIEEAERLACAILAAVKEARG